MVIEHKDTGLTLSVAHARYMEITKTENNEIQDSRDNSSTDESLVIETNTSRITTQKDDDVHLAIVTTQDRQFIQNK